MHVGSCLVFEGEAPGYREFVAQLERRLHLVPRYRQKLAFPPLRQARPVWVDDPHFNADYHVRHTALPAAGGRGRAAGAAGPRVLPAARPREAAVGAVARRPGRRGPLRDHLQDAPLPRRRHLRRRHRDGAVRPRARSAAGAAAPSRGCPAPSRRPRCSWSDAVAELAARPGRAGPRDRRRARASAARGGLRCRGGPRPRRARPRGARRRAALAPERPDRPAPALRVGRRRPRGVQGDQGGARRDGQRRGARGVAGALRTHLERHGEDPARHRAQARWCPSPCARTSSAARWATASPPSTPRCPSASPTRSRASARCTRRWAA